LLEKGRIFGSMALAAVAALGLALGTVFAVLTFDRGGVAYPIATVISLAVGAAFGTAVFVVAMGSKAK
jgi:hypothetical protein